MAEDKIEVKQHKLNNLPLGVLVGCILTGLPLWIYAEKQIERRTTISNSVAHLKGEVSGAKEADTILHRRITDSAQDDEKARKEILERLRAVEYYLKAVEIDVAVLKSSK